LAFSDYFLIRNLKYHLCETCFTDDESLTIAVETWFFSGHKQLRRKDEKYIDVAGEYVKNESICDIIC